MIGTYLVNKDLIDKKKEMAFLKYLLFENLRSVYA